MSDYLEEWLLRRSRYIRTTDLEIGKMYKVLAFGTYRSTEYKRTCVKVEIDGGYILLPERFDIKAKELKSKTIENLHIIYRGFKGFQDFEFSEENPQSQNYDPKNINNSLADELNELNNSYSRYIRFTDLEIGKKYKVHKFSTFESLFKRTQGDSNRIGVRVDIANGYLLLPERFDEKFEELQSKNIENLYIVFNGIKKKYCDIQFHEQKP